MTSRFMICRSRKANISAAANTPTAYQARAGLGQASAGCADAGSFSDNSGTQSPSPGDSSSDHHCGLSQRKRTARSSLSAPSRSRNLGRLEGALQRQVDLPRVTGLLLDVGLAEAAQVESIQVVLFICQVGCAERGRPRAVAARSEEHTSELQSLRHL